MTAVLSYVSHALDDRGAWGLGPDADGGGEARAAIKAVAPAEGMLGDRCPAEPPLPSLPSVTNLVHASSASSADLIRQWTQEASSADEDVDEDEPERPDEGEASLGDYPSPDASDGSAEPPRRAREPSPDGPMVTDYPSPQPSLGDRRSAEPEEQGISLHDISPEPQTPTGEWAQDHERQAPPADGDGAEASGAADDDAGEAADEDRMDEDEEGQYEPAEEASSTAGSRSAGDLPAETTTEDGDPGSDSEYPRRPPRRAPQPPRGSDSDYPPRPPRRAPQPPRAPKPPRTTDPPKRRGRKPQPTPPGLTVHSPDAVSEATVPTFVAEQPAAPADRRWACTFPGCSRAFARRFNCATHVATHLDVRRFECAEVCPAGTECGARFARVHDLKRHRAALHGEGKAEWCKCPGCRPGGGKGPRGRKGGKSSGTGGGPVRTAKGRTERVGGTPEL